MDSRKNEVLAVYAVAIAEAMGCLDEDLRSVRDAARKGLVLPGEPGSALATARAYVDGEGEVGEPAAVQALRRVAVLIQPLED